MKNKLPNFLKNTKSLDDIEIVQSCIHYIHCPDNTVSKEPKPKTAFIDWEQTFLLSFFNPPIRLSLTAARELHSQLGVALKGCKPNPKAGNLTTEEIYEKWGVKK